MAVRSLAPRGGTTAGGPRSPLWSRHLDDYVTALTVSSDGTRVGVATGSGVLHVLDADSGAIVFERAAHVDGILAAAYAPTGDLLATAGQDGRARVFDPEGGIHAEVVGSGAWMQHLAWSPDGNRLATTAGGAAHVWTPEGKLVLEIEPEASALTGIAWDRAGTRLATCCSRAVTTWDGLTGEQLVRLPTPATLVSLAWSPDDAVIACGTEQCSVRFWRLATGQESEISGFASKPRALSFNPTGKLLATAGGKVPSVWRFDGRGPEGMPPAMLNGHDALCTVLAFHPAGTWLATGGDDARVLIWDPEVSGATFGEFQLGETVTALAWRPDGRFIHAADASGLVEARLALAP